MEKNVERFTLNFSKGMTNTPNDLLCSDDELAICVGLTYKDGALVPIRPPKKIGTIPYRLMYVHKGADFENLIAYDEENGNIHWYKRLSDGGISVEQGSYSVGKVYDIKSVNNTLVCATDSGLHYLNYKNKTYCDLGTDLPTVKFTPHLDKMNYMSLGGQSVCKLEGMIESAYTKWTKAVYNDDGTLNRIEETSDASTPASPDRYYGWKAVNDVDKMSAFKEATVGHYNAILKKIKETNRFSFPFFVRCALKLYDGTYTRISAPILMFPSITRNCKFVPVERKDSDWVETPYGTTDFMAYINYATLQFKAEISDLGNWGDIVKELVVFASDEVKIMDLEEGFKFVRATESNGEAFIDYVNSDWKYGSAQDPGGYFPTVDSLKPVYKFTKDGYKARDVLVPAYYKTEAEIKDELLNKTQFYKLFSVSVDGGYINNVASFVDAPIAKHTVENLVTQEQLKTDDYYSWTSIYANKMYPYNKRLNIFDLKRSFFKGFNDLGQYSDIFTTKNFCYYTHIESNGTSAWVKSDDVAVYFPQAAATWLYYPDPNAVEMIIWDNTNGTGMRVKLKEHPMLNGAYYFGDLPTKDTFVADPSIQSIPTLTDSVESFDSQIFTSVVNNPFVFEASGDNTVGTGKIVGIAANTEAVSQGQFGQYPLLVFTTEGIYGMAVNSEGLYSAIYPISREVCYEDSPIVPTDKLIFFTSPKGLMATSGGEAVCVSQQMMGKSSPMISEVVDFTEDVFGFKNFIKGCKMAYDYKNNRLFMFKDIADNIYQYVYNLENKTFSIGMALSNIRVLYMPTEAVNDYPDTLTQGVDHSVYSFSQMSNDEDSEYTNYGIFLTRPLKLGGSLTLKSLRDIKNLYSLSKENFSVRVTITASNNCKDYEPIESLSGKPWKYYVLQYEIVMAECDCFCGSVVEVQTRRNDKMR